MSIHKNNSVIHFYRANSKESSRINSQIEIDKGICIDNMRLFDLNTVYYLFFKSSPGDSFVFHQQSSLFNLLICQFFNRYLKKDVKVIYDIHDMLELGNGKKIKSRLRFTVFYILEYIVFYIKIPTLTVSDGIAKVYLHRFGEAPKVFFNLPQLFNHNKCDLLADNKEKYIYFGQISNTRLPVNLLEILKLEGLSVDVYGFFNCDKEYYQTFKYFEKHQVVKYKGKYSPSSIHNIVSKYKYSLMYFESNSLNINYCLPNKLFQSLEARTRCIVSDNLLEVIDKFEKTGATTSLLQSFDENEDFKRNWETKAIEKINEMRLKSNQIYMKLIK